MGIKDYFIIALLVVLIASLLSVYGTILGVTRGIQEVSRQSKEAWHTMFGKPLEYSKSETKMAEEAFLERQKTLVNSKTQIQLFVGHLQSSISRMASSGHEDLAPINEGLRKRRTANTRETVE